MRQAARNGIISKNPMENTTPPKFKDSKKGKALSADIEKQFLEVAKDELLLSIVSYGEPYWYENRGSLGVAMARRGF